MAVVSAAFKAGSGSSSGARTERLNEAIGSENLRDAAIGWENLRDAS